MASPRSGFGRREFLATVGVGLPNWSQATATILPEPAVRWAYQVPDDTTAQAHLATRERVYVTSETGVYALESDGSVRWTLSVDGSWPEITPESTDDETLYVTTDDVLYAVERGDGAVRWRRGGGDETWQSATVVGDTVFGLGGHLAALSVADGSIQWEFDTASDGILEPVPADGVVVASTWSGVVHAVDATTGEERWSFERSYDYDGNAELQVVDVVESDSSALALVWDRLGDRLSALDVADGSVRWRFEPESDSFVFPGVVADDAVFAVDGHSFVRLFAADGTTRWRFEADAPLTWPTAIGDGLVYVIGEKGTLYVLSTADGTERWTFSTGTDGVVTSRTVGDVLVADDWNGTCYGLDPASGDLQWAFEYGSETGWFPQVVGDRVYVATRDGLVYALDSPPQTATGWLGRKTANGDSTALGGLLAGGALGGVLALASRRIGTVDGDQPPTWKGFEIHGRIGESDVATIFDARTQDGERLALKRFETGEHDGFSDALETWVGLDHDGVRPVREWGTDPEPWMTMAPADGGSLADHLDELGPAEGIEVVSRVAEIVHRAHREGVAHGRLHPGNVLFADEDREEVLVGDWLGAATRAPARGYAAPEQRADEETENRVAVDVYQLGCLAVHVLTGRPPRPAVGPSAVGDVPDELAEVLATALEPDPDDRHDSALAFRDVFRWAAFQA